MTTEAFKKLDLEKQYEYLLEWGFFIGRRATPELNMALYSVNGYFAEMIMDSRSGKIESVAVHPVIDKQLQQQYRISADNPFVRVSSGGAVH
jgi:hypothetical protein